MTPLGFVEGVSRCAGGLRGQGMGFTKSAKWVSGDRKTNLLASAPSPWCWAPRPVELAGVMIMVLP